ncbi:hypothetical protein HMPREF0693_3803 [Proteus mirabilis ATCC 29906]|nr:hypothetical protein HMPREF0693_3803 [Proteus mirabilis ATCC 29906]
MRLVYFVYQDTNAYERQSDGVEFCKIPSFIMIKFIFIVMNIPCFGILLIKLEILMIVVISH